MSFKRFLGVLLFSFFSQYAVGQLSKIHYIPPLTNDDGFSDQYIYISTPKNQSIAYKITAIGQPDLPAYSGIVSNTSPVEQPVLSNAGNNDFNNNSQLHIPIEDTSEIVSNKGFIIEAEDVVYVSIRVRSSLPDYFQAGALVSKGLSALGTDFRIGGMVNEGGPTGGYATFAAVLATEDNTQVTIDELPSGISIVNYTGTLPITINLNKHESYMLAVATNSGGIPNDLVGGLIRATKPIVVNSGSATGSFADTGGRDYGFDQIVGANKIGIEYIFVRGNGDDSWENVLIVAHDPDSNTDIFVNGNPTPIATISAGEKHVIEGGAYSTDGNLYVQTSKPVFAYQGIGGLSGQKPNQGLFFVPPLSCENRGNVDNIALIDKIGSGTFTGGITIVTNKEALVTVNDTNIEDLSGVQGPFDVEGNALYETYKISGLSGTAKVESTGELYCAYFNYSGFAASGSFYSGFPSAPEINFDATFATLGNCLPNVALEAANTDLFDSFEWFFDDGSGFVTTGNTTAIHTPTQPGKYKLITKIDCTGTVFESAEIPVSICPDNADGDGVIDNVDADIDNDGILNCDESFGDATINIADSTSPIIVFQDASTNAAMVSSMFAENSSGDTNTFTGQSNGDFTSVINSGSTSDLSYQLDFTEAINFKLTQQAGITHSITNGAYFILKIGPNNKNVTLLDPDDNLLVDTNFDGAFETNVLSFSGSEIHFKYNPEFTGTATFKFVANKVDQVIFQHISNGIASQATFQGNLSLTCFALDSDGDGIENALDVDSDNDGILDIYEAAAQNIVLSGNDLDNDGIDDVFDGLLTSSDTDGDGVLNYLDVDSDNDGIFDLVESGYNLTDANEDGLIDEATTATVGANGLLDALEDTSADTLLLLTPTSDTDGDGVFNFLELDADNDACFDVTEAGFSDDDSDGWLGASPVVVNNLGKVTSGVGYTTPNINYITSAPIIVNSFEDPTFCENETDVISIDSNADSFQWQVSTDGGTTFTNLTNDVRYSGVTTENLQITETPIGFNTYQYRVLLSRTGNSCLEQPSSAIILTVHPKPVFLNNPVTIQQCVNTPDGLTTLNLTIAESIISENPDGTFEYYEDAAGTSLITNSTAHPVEANIAQIVYVKVISAFGCSRELVPLNINVAETNDNVYDDIQPAVCDDFLDADGNDTLGSNDDTDNITQFFLDETAIINDINPPANTDIFFYENADDRANSLNDIDITNYRNDIDKIDITPIAGGIQFPIYYKLVSTLNNDCQGLGQFYLQIHSVPTAAVVENLIACDNLDDGNATNGEVAFDLESQTSTILGTQSAADYTVTYHKSLEDSKTGADALTSLYTNTSNPQTIYVRVANNTTGCFTNHEQFDLIVNPLPVANFVENIEICDDASDGSASNGFSQSIDLSVQTATILGTQDPTQFSVSYHTSLFNAQNNVDPVDENPYTNDTPFRETIYVRVYNETTGCANGISTFDVIVHGAPNVLLTDISNLSLCDDDADGDDTNGIVQNFDLTTQTTSILNNYDTALHDDFTISYHRSQDHAATGADPISDTEASQYKNTPQPDGSPERIYIRVTNKDTGCVSTDTYFDLIVNPLPDFEVTTPTNCLFKRYPFNLSCRKPNSKL